jgi:hypothetical protein
MTNVWVCGDCHSVNPMRSGRCYKCRAPRPPEGEEMAAAAASAFEAEPEAPRVVRMLDPQRVAASGFGQPPAPVEKTRPEVSKSAQAAINPAARQTTMPAAIVGIALLIVVLGIRLVLMRSSLAATEAILRGETSDPNADFIGPLGIFYPLFGVIAVGGLGFWASRVVANVPLLGGGWPRFTPGQAFLEHVIPGWNVLRTPGVYRDIQTRLSEDGDANDLLIVAWVLLNIAAIVIVRPIGSTLAGFADSVESALTIITVVNYLSISLQGLAILVIALLVFEIEGEQRDRARLLLAGDAAPAPPVANKATEAAHSAVTGRSVAALGGTRAAQHLRDRQPRKALEDDEPPPGRSAPRRS